MFRKEQVEKENQNRVIQKRKGSYLTIAQYYVFDMEV